MLKPVSLVLHTIHNSKAPSLLLQVLQSIGEFLNRLHRERSSQLQDTPPRTLTLIFDVAAAMSDIVDSLRLRRWRRRENAFVTAPRPLNYNFYIESHLHPIKDTLRLIFFRIYYILTSTHRQSHSTQRFLHVYTDISSLCDKKTPSLNAFEGALGQKLAKTEDLSYLTKDRDSKCLVCQQNDVGTDFAILDSCVHLLCPPCAAQCFLTDVIYVDDIPDDVGGAAVEVTMRKEPRLVNTEVNLRLLST